MMKQVCFEDALNAYIRFREVSRLSMTTVKHLRYMLSFCKREYPGDPWLTQDKIDRWGARRPKESGTTQASRVGPLNAFIDYLNRRNGFPFSPVHLEKKNPAADPVLFTEAELRNLFRACDETEVIRKHGFVHDAQLLNMLEFPVVFRLLYSSGMRGCEARLLSRSDVDTVNGIVHIRNGKGYDEHVVVLHETMLALVRKYDARMERLMPSRQPFFPDWKGGYHPKDWLAYHFRRLWGKYNVRRGVVVYSLRHHYAVHNVNAMPNRGYEITEELLALSRSMGHRSLDSTLYYYHLVPKFADIYGEIMGDTLQQTIPEP